MAVQFDAKAYWESRLAGQFDLRGVGDIGLSLSYNEYLYKVRASVFRRILRRLRLDPRKLEVLDVGSGTGFYVQQWSLLGSTVTGSDLTQQSIHALSERYPSTDFVEWDVGRPVPHQLERRCFDVVTALDVLFHVVDDANYASAIASFGRLVRPGGHLIFSDNLSEKVIQHGPHQLSRKQSDVSALLVANGFRKVAVFPMFVLMNDPVRTTSRLLRKLFARISAFAARGNKEGRLVGAILLPLELLLTGVLNRGPSTEIFVWQRSGQE